MNKQNEKYVVMAFSEGNTLYFNSSWQTISADALTDWSAIEFCPDKATFYDYATALHIAEFFTAKGDDMAVVRMRFVGVEGYLIRHIKFDKYQWTKAEEDEGAWRVIFSKPNKAHRYNRKEEALEAMRRIETDHPIYAGLLELADASEFKYGIEKQNHTFGQKFEYYRKVIRSLIKNTHRRRVKEEQHRAFINVLLETGRTTKEELRRYYPAVEDIEMNVVEEMANKLKL